MQAEKALKYSQRKVIVADGSGGLVIIQQSALEDVSAKSFHVRFVPRDAQEREDGSVITTVGSYDDLDIAVTIAAVKYGISGEEWMPGSRYALAILGSALLGDVPIDASLLSKRGPEQGE